MKISSLLTLFVSAFCVIAYAPASTATPTASATAMRQTAKPILSPQSIQLLNPVGTPTRNGRPKNIPTDEISGVPPVITAIIPTNTTTVVPTPAPVIWDVYDPDPQHLWNRLFRQLYVRTSKDGKEYGRDSLDLLQWDATSNFFGESSYSKTIQLLDEFLSGRGETMVTDPLKRALFQRDLWAVFDWLIQSDDHSNQRHALELRLAQVMRRIALTQRQIESLPNNYQAVVNSRAFPANYQENHPDLPFLPVGFFASDGDWVPLGRKDSPNAFLHVQSDHFLGRSAFLIFIRVPGGRAATLDFVRQLKAQQQGSPAPELPVGAEVALVRQMMLIDQQGKIVASPLIESIQFRHFYTSNWQRFYEFTLSRDLLLAGKTGGLRPLARAERGFPLFNFFGTNFVDSTFAEIERHNAPVLLGTCATCHENDSRSGMTSIISVFRGSDFSLPDADPIILTETTPALEAQETIAWKLKQPSWSALQALWQKAAP